MFRLVKKLCCSQIVHFNIWGIILIRSPSSEIFSPPTSPTYSQLRQTQP
jgi:hypothetical protein